jgi:hypothetical protein
MRLNSFYQVITLILIPDKVFRKEKFAFSFMNTDTKQIKYWQILKIIFFKSLDQ